MFLEEQLYVAKLAKIEVPLTLGSTQYLLSLLYAFLGDLIPHTK